MPDEPTPTPAPEPAPEPAPAPAPVPTGPVIDAAAWEKAGWKAVLLGFDPEGEHPPFIGLQFSDEAAGREIFAGWRARFGGRDGKDALKVGIVQSGDGSGYTVQLSDPAASSVPARGLRNTPPPKSTNLADFKKAFAKHKRYTLVPVTIAGGEVTFDMEMAFDKTALHTSTQF
jgi:hypothetical protein